MRFITDPTPQNPVVPGIPPRIIPIVPTAPRQTEPTRTDYNKVANSVSERQGNVAGLNELLCTIFGTDQVGASITAVVTSGTNLLLRCEWCKGPIDSVSSYLVDGAAPTAGMSATHYDGTQVTPDAALVAAFAAFGKTYSDTLTGVAYSVITVAAGTTQGWPRVVATIRGLKVRTAAGGSYAYSSNPVWLVGWLLTERLQVSIDWSSFATAAAYCDSLVGGEKRFIMGLSMDTEQDVWKWIDLVLGYIHGHRWYDNGVYGLTVETAAQTSVMHITEPLMRNGDIEINTRDLKNAPTVVRIHYTNKQNALYEDAYAEVQLAGVGTTVPYVLSEIRKPGIDRHSQANRDAIETLNGFWLCDESGSFVTRDQGLKLLEGDVISISHSRGPSAKPVHVLNATPVEAGRWRIDWLEYDPARYSDAVTTTPTYADTNLPLPTNPPTVDLLTLAEEYVTQPSGALPLSRIRGSWTGLVYPFLIGYRVVIKNAAGVTVDDQLIGPTPLFVSAPLVALTEYTVYVYARSAIAQSGTASSGSVVLSGAGIESLSVVTSQPITPSGWFIDGDLQYTLYPGDAELRLRRTSTQPMATIYAGPTMATPGNGSMLLDALRNGPSSLWTYSEICMSPVYDFGALRSGVFAVLNVQEWAALYADALKCEIFSSDNVYLSGATITVGWRAVVTNQRYMRIRLRAKEDKFAGSSVYRRFWAIEFANAFAALLMPTVTDNFTVTSSAAGPITVQLPRRYVSVNPPQVSATYAGTANPNASGVTTSETVLAGNYMTLQCTDQAGAFIAVPCSITITGVAA